MIGKMVRSSMRKAAFLAAATIVGLAVALPSAYAQADPAAEAKMKELMKVRGDRLATDLALTPEQVSQLQKINAETVRKMKAMGENKSSDKKAQLNEIKKITSDREAALSKVLNPEQRKKYQEMNQEDVAMLQTEAMAQALKLKEEQIEQVDQINLAAIKSISAARNERNKLKKARTLRAAADKKNEEMKKVLTSEQWTAYQAMQEKPKK